MSEVTENALEQIHATAVMIDGLGVVLRGPSGSGKSDVALRLIDGGATLVADDRVDVYFKNGRLFCASPEPLRGLMEIRGIGIMKMDFALSAPVSLVVDLVPEGHEPRLPDSPNIAWKGMDVRYLKLFSFAASTPAKIRLALTAGPEAMVEPI